MARHTTGQRGVNVKPVVIISHYERQDLLYLCLLALAQQTHKDFGVIVTNDGSESVSELSWPLGFHEVWQEHEGFGKARVMNKALVRAKELGYDYFIATDQDTILAPNFVETHLALAEPGFAVCGFYTSLGPHERDVVSEESIASGSIWSAFERWRKEPLEIWAGNMSSAWISDALAVNGFDERFGWCGDDMNFGLRLKRTGVGFKQCCELTRGLHVWHDRPYAEDKQGDYRRGNSTEANRLAAAWAAESYWTPQGIVKT
jgi:GT2 family glycosyltransferase